MVAMTRIHVAMDLSKIKRKQSVQKAEQLMVVKYSDLFKGMLGMLWTIIIGYMM